MKKIFFAWSVLMMFCTSIFAQVTIRQSDKDRAVSLVRQMTLDEKIDYIAGEKSFYMRAIPRLGIPQIRMADGPQGIRNNTKSTLYPCGIMNASTWNRELALELGRGLGRDARARGVDILLGPGVNIYRSPLCGRNFEYMGEDPFLAGEIAKYYILGVQEMGVMATVKHFAANNQEYSRHSVSSDVDERTLNEIYFPAFRKAVQEAGVGAVMDSYNLVNGVHSTENPWMNITVLRDRWGFEGIVMSDWTSVYSTQGAVNGGLDMEQPKAVFFTRERVKAALEKGLIREKDLDIKCQHLLQTLSAFGMLDRPIGGDKSIPEDNAESKATALQLAREGAVLLKNESALPLSRKEKVLLMGPNVDRITFGGGSGEVTPFSSISVYEGMVAEFGAKKVTLLSDDMLYEDIVPQMVNPKNGKAGFAGRYAKGHDPHGAVVLEEDTESLTFAWKYGAPDRSLPDDHFAAYWTTSFTPKKSGTVRFVISGDDGYRVFVDGKQICGHWGNHSLSTRSVFFDMEAGRKYEIKVEYYENVGEATLHFTAGMLNEQKLQKMVSEASSVVYCAGFDKNTEGEGFDRPFSLPESQVWMMNQIAALGAKINVVVNAGGAVNFNGWSDKVASVLMAWYPGQEGGTAIAEILSGKVSPSGKLPISMENEWEDNPVFKSYYDKNRRVEYSEGVFVGYRGYDRNGVKPRYPFGFGLSYTSFEYSDLQVEKNNEGVNVSFSIKNTGKCDAMEVAQVYVRDESCSVLRPEKELKGFEKVFIPGGKSVKVTIPLGKDAFSFYDVDSHEFVLEPGAFKIMVGPSSADLPLSAQVNL